MFDRSLLLSKIPGLVHGFSDRAGGVSVGRYATLNLGAKWGDAPAAVAQNTARLAKAAGFDAMRLRRVRQVHGTDVLAASAVGDDAEADGLWCTPHDGVIVGVHTADCVPLLLASRDGTVAAAIHSGWRGTVANIAAACVRAISDRARPGELVAAIGPCIELARFEVGDEVAAQFPPRFVARVGFTKPHVDLVAMITAQLVGAGLSKDAIERVGGCTHANEDQYFSYRRDGAGIGQMLTFAGFSPS